MHYEKQIACSQQRKSDPIIGGGMITLQLTSRSERRLSGCLMKMLSLGYRMTRGETRKKWHEGDAMNVRITSTSIKFRSPQEIQKGKLCSPPCVVHVSFSRLVSIILTVSVKGIHRRYMQT